MLQASTPLFVRVCRSYDILRKALILCLLTAVIPAVRAATSTAKKTYELAAGDATGTLKEFVAQSGEQVLFLVNKVRGVKTNPVKGDFTAREALDRMVADTGLAVVEDAKTGALMINRNVPPKAEQPSQSDHQTGAPKEPKTSMKRTKLTALLFAAAAILNPLAAQSVAPPDDTPVAEPVVELSPFVVNSTADTGYQATSTLAGTRLNTPLKDIGASISVYTKDLLEDIGATDANELLIFATGMEAAGPGGNYSGATNDINAGGIDGDSARVDPQQTARTRGLASPNFTRGFFITDISMDSYNTERVTVNRGPNAILFGVSSPAGVVDSALLRPNLNRNANELVFRYGNNDSLRGTLDVNRVLIPRKLALRVAAVNDREEYNQRPAFQHKKRVYGALTFEPFRSTSIRANFETGHTRANRPIGVLPFNSSSAPWHAAGREGFDWTYYDDPARNPNARNDVMALNRTLPGYLIGQNQFANQFGPVYTNPDDEFPSYAIRSHVPSTGGTQADRLKNQLFHPTLNRDMATDRIQFWATRNINELPGAYWVGDNVLPGQLPGFKPAGLRQQGFTDFTAFDFENQMIDETGRQSDSFHSSNIILEQRGWDDRLGVELVYDNQRFDRRSKNGFFSGGANHVRVDPNLHLTNGEPNPNYGRPFVVHGPGNWTNFFSEREGKRATGYIKYDFTDLKASWARHFGRHTLTGLYEENAIDIVNYRHRLAGDGPAARSINPNINDFNREPREVVYLGPSIIGNNNPLRLSAIRIPERVAGLSPVTLQYFQREAGSTDLGRFVDTELSFVEVNRGGNAQREVIKSKAAILQSYWLKDHLVTMVGWRRDEDYFASESISFKANPDDPNDPGKVHYGFNDFGFPGTPPPNVSKEVKSYSAVLRWPQKMIKMPWNTDMSVFYNKSENFTPIGGRVTGFGENLASPEGITEEYGFNFYALNDKLRVRVNWFETSITGQSYRPGVYGTAINNAVLQIAQFWAEVPNRNPNLQQQVDADIEVLFSALPPGFRGLYDFKITGALPNLSVAHLTSLPGGTDTTDYTAKGTEIEVVYNPTRNWRIMANIAKQETVQSNSLPFLKDFIARMTPVWDQLGGRPRAGYPDGYQVGDPLPPSTGTLREYIDTSIMVPFASAIATEGSASAEQRKWRANLVTNYSFGRDSIFGEKLNGWGIGAAVRWQDKIGIGYPAIRNADESVTLDIAHPHYRPAETNVDAWVSYKRRIWNNRIDWKVQLNVRNLIADMDPIATGVQPWGTDSQVRLAPERRWYITNTFSF